MNQLSKCLCVVFESESYENFQVRPRRGPGHHVQALDGAGDADQARWQSRTGSRSLSACQQV